MQEAVKFQKNFDCAITGNEQPYSPYCSEYLTGKLVTECV